MRSASPLLFLEFFPFQEVPTTVKFSTISPAEKFIGIFPGVESAVFSPLSMMVVAAMPSAEFPFRGFNHLAAIANDLANGDLFANPPSPDSPTFNLESTLHRLMLLFREITDADVAFVRKLDGNNAAIPLFLPVGKDNWRDGLEPVGVPPSLKHSEDGPCKRNSDGDPITDGGDRDERYNKTARERIRSDGNSFYSLDELTFLEWLASEAWIVVKVNEKSAALICLGSERESHFTEEKIDELRMYEYFVSAFYRLAELADERSDKINFIGKISQVLPILAKNSDLAGFQRAILTLLTCEHGGFRFDRAFMFWMENHELPATCKMAIGGTSRDWMVRQAEIREEFRTLSDYIEDAIRCPIPGSPAGNLDPLYRAVQEAPIQFGTDDTGILRKALTEQGQWVRQLTSRDPWIQRIQRQYPGVLNSPHDQYFVFPLNASFGSHDGRPRVLGFVVADSPYHNAPHDPANSSPDLIMALHVLSVVACVWAAHEEAANHFNVVSCLPILRHNAPMVEDFVNALEFQIKQPSVDISKISDLINQSISCATELTQAVDLLVDKRTELLSHSIDDPKGFITDCLSDRQIAHDGKLIIDSVSDKTGNAPLRISRHVLRSLLSVLVNNAVASAIDHGSSSVHVTVTIDHVAFPQAKGSKRNHVRIAVRNDGPPILPPMDRYLFVHSASTHSNGVVPHRGIGLASARLQAQTFDGDLLLSSTNPVEFEIISVLK